MINQIEVNCMKTYFYSSVKKIGVLLALLACAAVIISVFVFLFREIRTAGDWLYVNHHDVFSLLTLCATTISIFLFWFFYNCKCNYYKLSGRNSVFFMLVYVISLLMKISFLIFVIITMSYTEPVTNDISVILPIFFISMSLFFGLVFFLSGNE